MIKLFWVIILCVLQLCRQQHCMNAVGEPVDWWIVLKVPPMTKNYGYGYYDASMRTAEFVYINKPVDTDVSPLTQTLSLISRDRLQRIAWNDEKPNNQTSSSVAHSKGLIAYSKQSAKGYLIVHSIPKYPAFFQNHTINMTIGKSQQVYGQHIACFSLSLLQLNTIAFNLQLSHLFIYESLVTASASTTNLHNLVNQAYPPIIQLFNFYEMRPQGYRLKGVFKANTINGSIFEDGLVGYLKDGKLVAETWGRPLQVAWCNAKEQVLNVKMVRLTENVMWTEVEDHSKWVLAEGKYVCFGDMNRMTSQWKRGGAFYCLQDPYLHQAMKKIVVSTDTCTQNNWQIFTTKPKHLQKQIQTQ